MNIRFDNKTVLVTGAGRGIGRALAEKLALLGAKVIAVSKSQSNLDSLKKALPEVVTVQADLKNWNETKEKLKDYVAEVDHLVNNAATSAHSLIGDFDEKDIDEVFNVNYKGSLNLIQLVVKGMQKRKYGSIVNVSSVSGMAALDTHCVYGSTKSAMDLMTKIAAKELGKYNIRVNSVNPTVVWTDMGREYWCDEEIKGEMLAKIPMARFVEVKEVVDPILFLLSDYAAMINGVQLPIDGGFTAA